MQITKRLATIAVFSLALDACTSTGTGGGQLAASGGQQTPVVFSWKSNDGGISGTMTASLPDSAYQGRFFQITQHTRGEVLAPLWMHWRQGWYDWPYWGPYGVPAYPATQFITYYSGKVVATLESEGKQAMRCRFHLVNPSQGMSGGGEGECQLADGRSINASFPSQ
jgi:hypothetical protein